LAEGKSRQDCSRDQWSRQHHAPRRHLVPEADRNALQFRPLPGLSPRHAGLLSGQIDLYIGLPADLLPQLRAGNIKVHAIAARHRLLTAPDIPTAGEAGLPGFEVSAWFGFWAPKGTPREIVAKLHAATREALADAVVRQRLQQQLHLAIPAP